MAEIMKEQAQEASVLDALLGATVPSRATQTSDLSEP